VTNLKGHQLSWLLNLSQCVNKAWMLGKSWPHLALARNGQVSENIQVYLVDLTVTRYLLTCHS